MLTLRVPSLIVYPIYPPSGGANVPRISWDQVRTDRGGGADTGVLDGPNGYGDVVRIRGRWL